MPILSRSDRLEADDQLTSDDPGRLRGAAVGSSIVLASVSKSFATKNRHVHALRDVSLNIARGEFVSLVGKSGCGKSTLLAMVGGLIPASSGAIQVDGQEVSGPQTDFGFVFQAPTLLRWRTALANVLLQAEAKRLPKAEAEQRARSLLESVGLGNALHQRPGQLSGGMQQRVGICRALLHDPATFLMDEPFSALDEITRDEMCVQLQELWLAKKRTVLFVTHSIAEAVFLSDRVIVLADHPSRVALDLTVDLPRPRDLAVREEPEFGKYVRSVRAAL